MLFNIDLISKVDYPEMNEVHLEELLMANEIYEYLASPIEHEQKVIEEKLKDFIFHVRDHFGYEEAMMKETNCPILGCHEGEHVRVQRLMIQVFNDYGLSGDIQLLKDYLEFEFKPWIENHILTMDTVTAIYLSSIARGEDVFQNIGHSCGTNKC